MGKLKSWEEFQEDVNEVYGEGEWEVISYVGTSSKVDIRHKCGTERSISRANNFLKGSTQCKECEKSRAGRPKLDFDKMAKRISKTTKGKYELVSLDSSTEMVINHLECDREPFTTTTTRFFTRGQRCQCTKKGKVGKKTHK